jgi:DNA endonuclease I-HmuI-like, NUMOD-like domain
MNTNLKPVSQYRDGVLIARYPSIAVAAFLSETQPAHIGKVAAGLRETAGGFYWEFAQSFGVNLTRTNSGLSQIDLENDGSVVALYDSIETAALMSGLTITQINKVLSGNRKSVDGYTFR